MTIGIFRSAIEAAKAGEDVQSKTFLVTGAYSGIGVETVKALLAVGASKVIVCGRNAQLQQAFVESVEESVRDRIDASHTIDLADLASVREFAKYVDQKYTTIDVLICNAGVMNTPPCLTKDGFEQQFGINVLGHFLLCWILARKTKRQVWVSSYGHTLKGGKRINLQCMQGDSALENYDGFLAYQQSKLGNILLAKEFAKRFPGLEAVSLHPGTIHTSLYRDSGLIASLKMGITMIPGIVFGNISQVFPKSASMGASTTLTCATLPSEQLINGGYYSNCAIAQESDAAKNEQDAQALYDFCETATKPFQTL